MSVNDYQQWIKEGRDLGIEGDELKSFVKERQAELREERAKEREEEKAKRQMEDERAKRQMEDERAKRQMEIEEEKAKRQMEDERAKRQMEIEEEKAKRQMEDERAKRQMEIEEEKAKRQIEDERAKRQMEIEEEKAKRQMEDERAKRQMELEVKKLEAEIKVKEIEARAAYDRRQSENHNGIFVTEREEGNNINHRRGMRDIKFPNFNENKDCLDAYLLRFERTVEAYEIPQEIWALTLARHLEGKALEVYQRLNSTEAQDYNCLKDQLLRRFRLTEDGYRQRFRNSRIEIGETCSQFFERLRRYIQQWLTMAGFEKDYEGLENLILRDQFFLTCSMELKTFLTEKGKINVKEMLTHAESYIEAHGYKHGDTTMKSIVRFSQDKNQNRGYEEKTKDKVFNTANRGRAENKFHKELNFNRYANRDYNRERAQSVEPKIICYSCGGQGHKANISTNKPKGVIKHTTAAIQVFENSLYKARMEAANLEAKQNLELREEQETLVKKDGLIDSMTNTMLTDNNDGLLNLNREESGYKVVVNGRQVEVLYDSGATCCVVKRAFIDKADLTGKEAMCTLIDGSTRYYPTANIDIEGDYYTGKVEALVMDNPVKPMIIGKINGLKYMLSKDKKNDALPSLSSETRNTHRHGIHKDLETKRRRSPCVDDVTVKPIEDIVDIHSTAAIETRASTNKIERYKPLKLTEMPDIKVTPDEIRKLQEEDESLKKYREMSEHKNTEGIHTDKIQFIKQNGLLYRKYNEVLKDDVKLQLMVPKPLRDKVLKIAHCCLLSAHLGIKKTHDKICNDFYWPSINQDVRRFVLSCDICQRTVDKKVTYREPMGHLPVLDIPYKCICVDIIGPINPMSSRGHRYVLTIIDLSTRYPDAIPLKGIST